MPYWIRAYNGNNLAILGDFEGQGVIRHRRPESSPRWHTIRTTARRHPHVAYWTIEDYDGRALFTYLNPHFKGS